MWPLYSCSKPMHLAVSLVSRFLFPIFEHWSKVKPRALAPCFHWLHAFSLLALSMGACRVRPSFTCRLQGSMTGMQKLSLKQHSCSTGVSDPFSTHSNGIAVNGYKQLSKKRKKLLLLLLHKAKVFTIIDKHRFQFSNKCWDVIIWKGLNRFISMVGAKHQSTDTRPFTHRFGVHCEVKLR